MMGKKRPAVYIMASKRNGTLYVGETVNLAERVAQHKEKQVLCFTQQYDIVLLVWYQYFDLLVDAVAAEKRMKKWNREWKIRLIEKDNPYWRDLADEVFACGE